MRVDILANDRASFIKPMAEGLARMLGRLGVDARLHYDGLGKLMLRQSFEFSSPRAVAGSTLRLRRDRREFEEFAESLNGTDVIVVVANVPGSFARALLPNIELLRSRFPDVPIVNYDLHYLPTLYSWGRQILRGESTLLHSHHTRVLRKGYWGLERYDWYLMASVGTEVPLTREPHPYSLIGLDLDDGSLYPDQKGSIQALVDFPQNRLHYPEFREIQIEALRLAGVDYVALDGSYTTTEIRKIYRASSIYFLASAEAFGLPICELQACGAKVFLPDPHWAASHWLGKDYFVERAPELSPNFVVYENDAHALSHRIRQVADSINPAEVRATFERVQPELLHGDIGELKSFLERIDSGAIHSRLHGEHASVARAG
jgi:hypothetical protein